MESERPIAQIAADLGMHPEAPRRRVRQAEADSASVPSANEILKTASVFCQGARPRPTEVSRCGRDLVGSVGAQRLEF